ncbi:hypothetical protein I316_00008 [Kwoniella heveanensis BCC8398]|uniref:Ribosomal protein/NADH dehydrogenase domain-containing protein n=1 Tax=Kwoniella heveanensis BCC8398 TaxID=1296120 RepID=A0A1B9H3D5_9TREE|nr:hypothetical protein I316_00008 [Kwoniella heveanensis BCC8398]
MSSAASSSIRRLPFREAVSSLRQGTEKVTLSSDVAGVTLRFVAKNSEPGPRQFLRNHAPRLAYANPTLPFTIERIRDPRTKSKDPNNPDKGAVWEGGVMPKPEMVIAFRNKGRQTGNTLLLLSGSPLCVYGRNIEQREQSLKLLLLSFLTFGSATLAIPMTSTITITIANALDTGIGGSAPAQTVPLTHLDGDKILAQLLSVAGEERLRGIEAPSSTSGPTA